MGMVSDRPAFHDFHIPGGLPLAAGPIVQVSVSAARLDLAFAFRCSYFPLDKRTTDSTKARSSPIHRLPPTLFW